MLTLHSYDHQSRRKLEVVDAAIETEREKARVEAATEAGVDQEAGAEVQRRARVEAEVPMSEWSRVLI